MNQRILEIYSSQQIFGATAITLTESTTQKSKRWGPLYFKNKVLNKNINKGQMNSEPIHCQKVINMLDFSHDGL